MLGDEVTREFLETIIPELIKEALVEDDRIDDVSDFIVKFESNNVYISFAVFLCRLTARADIFIL